MKINLFLIVSIVLFGFCLFVMGCSSSSSSAPPAQEQIPPEEEPPAQQTVAPVINAVSIGVPDLDAAVEFYRDTIGMELLADGDYPDYLNQEGMNVAVLASRQAGRRGAMLVLMNDPAITDAAYYTDNPDKLVFIVPCVDENDPYVDNFYSAILANGGSEVGNGGTPPETRTDQGYPAGVRIGMAYDLNGYLVEMLAFPAAMITSVTVTDPYIIGVGIGVSNLRDSRDYYTRILGMVYSADLDVPNFMLEVELATPSGARPNMVLMHYEATKDYTDNPVRLVFTVPDAGKYFDFVEAEAPDQILKPLATLPSGAKSGEVKDLDGTTIQIVQPAP